MMDEPKEKLTSNLETARSIFCADVERTPQGADEIWANLNSSSESDFYWSSPEVRSNEVLWFMHLIGVIPSLPREVWIDVKGLQRLRYLRTLSCIYGIDVDSMIRSPLDEDEWDMYSENAAWVQDWCTLEGNAREIAARLDLSHQSVYYKVNKLQLPKQRYIKRQNRRFRVLRNWNSETFESIRKLSEAISVPRDVVSEILREEGIWSNNPHFYEEVDPEELFHLYVEENQSLEELSKRYSSYSTGAIRRALEHYDIPIRPSKHATGDYLAAVEDWKRSALSERPEITSS